MDCRRRSAVDDDRSRRIRLAVDDDRRRGRWAVDDDRSRIAFYQAQVNESLDQIDNNLRSIDKNLRSIRRMQMSSATIPASSSSLLSAASRDRKQFRDQPALDDYYPPLELPLRWRNPPPFQHSNRAPSLSQTTATPPKSSTIRPARTEQSHPKVSSKPPSSPIVTEATDSASFRNQTCNPDSASSRDQTTAHELPASHTPNSFSNSLHDFSPFDSATDTPHDRSPLPVRSDDPKPTPASIQTALLLPLRFRDSLPDKANAAAIFETQSQSLLDEFEEAVDGGVHILALGALDNSFPISDSGILVVRKFNNGVHGKGVSVKISGHGNNYSTPLKTLLMRGETNMLLMSQRNSAKPHASGVDQLDIETGKFVTEWKFEKDGIDITRRDITNDSKGSQLDQSESTFLGLNDNRFCQWDMRDRRGLVQNIANSMESSVLQWSQGHRFARGINFQCFATTGDGSIVVGSLDGKIRLYSKSSMRMAKTAFPGLGSPITHVDVTFDGKWLLGTTDTYLIFICTIFKDKDGKDFWWSPDPGGTTLPICRVVVASLGGATVPSPSFLLFYLAGDSSSTRPCSSSTISTEKNDPTPQPALQAIRLIKCLTTVPLPPCDQALENIRDIMFYFLTSHNDRNAASLIGKSWFNTGTHIRLKFFMGNCYAVSKEKEEWNTPKPRHISS